MSTIKDRPTLQDLARRQTELRNRLARAWQMNTTAEVIHRIEEEIMAVWAALEEIDTTDAPDQSTPTDP